MLRQLLIDKYFFLEGNEYVYEFGDFNLNKYERNGNKVNYFLYNTDSTVELSNIIIWNKQNNLTALKQITHCSTHITFRHALYINLSMKVYLSCQQQTASPNCTVVAPWMRSLSISLSNPLSHKSCVGVSINLIYVGSGIKPHIDLSSRYTWQDSDTAY